MSLWSISVIGVGLLPYLAIAQTTDTLLSPDTKPLASFSDARSISVDPNGVLYVADAGKDVVQILSSDGALSYTLGGTGSKEGQFDEPVDVDPTNGLVLIIADYGNGRLQRFSSEHSYLGSISVSGSSASRQPSAAGDVFRSRVDAAADHTGRPSSVMSSSSNELYAIDASRGVVLKWDSRQRQERVIGGYDASDGVLEEPVSLALDGDGKVYVADRKRGEVLVYDRFGSFARAFGNGRLDRLRSVVIAGDRLWIVAGSQLISYDLNGPLHGVYELGTDEPVVDVAVKENVLFLLTARYLYRVTL